MRHADRFVQLQALLAAHGEVWRPAPFHQHRPGWTRSHPALAAAVLALDEATVDGYAADPAAAADWLGRRLPGLAELRALSAADPLPLRDLPAAPRTAAESVPERKRRQVEAFAAVAPAVHAPLVEWCAGKGHLGRRLALADGVDVCSLERDPLLCAEADRLARRAGVHQHSECVDVLAPGTAGRLRGREVVALHACGELHRSLVRDAASAGAVGYRIAPCCYHHGVDGLHRPLSAQAKLPLAAPELRLAVTELVTAPAGARPRLARDQAWKLGFKAMAAALDLPLRPTFRPVPAAWLAGDFERFCRALAEREALILPARLDWHHWLAAGERRRAEVRRLELVRQAFRRALETWLVLDLAVALEAAGFEVALGSFCARRLTPRNLMLVARG
ncbi:MAG: methyltransferase [Rhodocyclaceae bacterium]|nr:methyltransferase [Rhodocyclaceae bacterium]